MLFIHSLAVNFTVNVFRSVPSLGERRLYEYVSTAESELGALHTYGSRECMALDKRRRCRCRRRPCSQMLCDAPHNTHAHTRMLHTKFYIEHLFSFKHFPHKSANITAIN